MNRIAFLALWVLVFSTAWEEVVEVAGFGRISRVIGLAALAVGILCVLAARSFRRLTPAHGIVMLFVCWSAASIFWSPDPESTFRSSFTYAQLALLLWLIWEIARTARQRLALLQAYVLGAYFSAGYTIALYLTNTAATTRYAASGFNPNDLGFTLVLALPMAWYLALSSQQRAVVWLNRLYLPVGIAAIALTASRGAAIPAVVALMLVPWTLVRVQMRTRIVLALLVAASAYGVGTIVPPRALERLATTRSEIQDGSFSSRGEIWRAGWEVFRRHPFVGVGAGTFAEAVEPVLGQARSPHQSFLAVLVGQGLVGLTLFLAIFVAAMGPIPWMPPLERKFWTILSLTLLIGLLPRTWDYRKPTWLVLGVLIASSVQPARREGGVRIGVRPPLAPADAMRTALQAGKRTGG